jgi:predicted CopG family antitoxin
MSKQIVVSDETYELLTRIKGLLTIARGRGRVSFDDVIVDMLHRLDRLNAYSLALQRNDDARRTS